jgi:predicted CoA-substrate-specific enzyme activase
MIVAGVDVGSTATKAALLDENRKVIATALTETGANVVRAAERAFKKALETAGLEEWEVGYTVGTGYGRYKVPFGNAQITEITCHAKGASALFPGTRTILDIGGQDTQAIRISERGEVLDFCMNDKCAAGTGRFLSASADVLELTLDEIGPVSLRAPKILKITNVCTVFVEAEIMNQLARGSAVEEILAGVHASIAGRSIGLLRRVGLEDEITFTGGVSRNIGMVAALETRLARKLNVHKDAQFIGAIGASLFALERAAHGDGASHGDGKTQGSAAEGAPAGRGGAAPAATGGAA